MASPLHRLLRWVALGIIALGCLGGVWYAGVHGGVPAVVEVNGRPLLAQELAEGLRAHLWRHNEAWARLSPEARRELRQRVLQGLVEDRLLLDAMQREDGVAAAAALPAPAARREAEMMQRQFAAYGEFPQRLAAQQLTPKALVAGIDEAQRVEAWMARKIQPQLGEITAQAVRAWYDKNREALRVPEAWHAAHVFLTRHDAAKPDREREIREIQRQLVAKEKTFAELAAQYSEDERSKKVGGDLGWFAAQRMPEDFIAAVEKLGVGQYSGPVPTKLGWHILWVKERRDSRLPTFEEAKAEIAARLTSQRRAEAVQSLLEKLRGQAESGGAKSVVYHSAVIDRTEPAP